MLTGVSASGRVNHQHVALQAKRPAHAHAEGRGIAAEHLLPMMRPPHSMTGSIFAHLPSVCSGKVTYFNASYWQVVAVTFDSDTAAYAYSGAAGLQSCFVHCTMALQIVENQMLTCWS